MRPCTRITYGHILFIWRRRRCRQCWAKTLKQTRLHQHGRRISRTDGGYAAMTQVFVYTRLSSLPSSSVGLLNHRKGHFVAPSESEFPRHLAWSDFVGIVHSRCTNTLSIYCKPSSQQQFSYHRGISRFEPIQTSHNQDSAEKDTFDCQTAR